MGNQRQRKLAATAKRKDQPVKKRPGYTRGKHLEWLHQNNHISDLEYRAGAQIRALFTEREGRAKSFDLENDRVDGGGPKRDFLLVASCDADKQLRELGRFLGVDQACAVFLVVGMGYSVKAVLDHFQDINPAGRTAGNSRAASDYIGRLIKSGLAHAAFYFGYAASGPEAGSAKRAHFFRSVTGAEHG